MGSGKTTLGERLASRLGVPFVDLDARLEARCGASIRAVFERGGEPEFRRLELEELRLLVQEAPAACVVAVGGGVVETEAAPALLRRLGRIVWLRADPHACVARLGGARGARPLLDPGTAWTARWRRREPLYRALAEAIVETHSQGIDASLEQLVHLTRPPRAAGA